jgi:hypothetical protein
MESFLGFKKKWHKLHRVSIKKWGRRHLKNALYNCDFCLQAPKEMSFAPSSPYKGLESSFLGPQNV